MFSDIFINMFSLCDNVTLNYRFVSMYAIARVCTVISCDSQHCCVSIQCTCICPRCCLISKRWYGYLYNHRCWCLFCVHGESGIVVLKAITRNANSVLSMPSLLSMLLFVFSNRLILLFCSFCWHLYCLNIMFVCESGAFMPSV